MTLNWADWTIIAIVAVSCLISLMRGFVREALSLASWILATFVAIAFYGRLAEVFANWIETPSIRSLLAFAALFVVTLLIGALLSRLLRSLLSAAGLGGIDRLLGTVFGAARGLLIVLALVILLPLALPVNQDAWWHESRLIPHFEALEGWAHDTFTHVMGWGRALTDKAQSVPAGG